jgi:hypothetical protein
MFFSPFGFEIGIGIDADWQDHLTFAAHASPTDLEMILYL